MKLDSGFRFILGDGEVRQLIKMSQITRQRVTVDLINKEKLEMVEGFLSLNLHLLTTPTLRYQHVRFQHICSEDAQAGCEYCSDRLKER